ncbi:MAG: hypothetical protein R2711_14995 [Acidimicrobiales bacterium]
MRIVGRRKNIAGSGFLWPLRGRGRAPAPLGHRCGGGRPAHPDWGEEVVAVVEGGDRGADGALASLAAEELAAYKRPKRIVHVDALPRNALGKVVKAEVRDLVG